MVVSPNGEKEEGSNEPSAKSGRFVRALEMLHKVRKNAYAFFERREKKVGGVINKDSPQDPTRLRREGSARNHQKQKAGGLE